MSTVSGHPMLMLYFLMENGGSLMRDDSQETLLSPRRGCDVVVARGARAITYA